MASKKLRLNVALLTTSDSKCSQAVTRRARLRNTKPSKDEPSPKQRIENLWAATFYRQPRQIDFPAMGEDDD